MVLCDDGHEEICYSSEECPLCMIIATVCELEDQVATLQNEVDGSEDIITSLREELEDLKTPE